MSMRYPGGLIATSPVNAAYPSGVWTQAQAIPYQSQNVWTRDQYWPYTTLLLQGNGTNGAQNNTFLDSSTNNFSVTRNGNTTQGSFTPYEANGYWSNFNPDSDNGIGVATNSALNMGTGDFTVEAWVNTAKLPTTNAFQTSPGGYQCVFGTGPNNSATGSQLYIGVTNLKFDIASDGSGPIDVAHNMVAGQWYHIAITRSGTTFRAFINGVLVQTATGISTSWVDGYAWGIMRGEAIGAYGGAWWYGYVSNLRVLKGTALYTSTFTPSTTPLTAIANTSLLTCQSNRFVDNSSNAFAITVNGSPSVQAFQPFPGQTTYSTSVLGGSGYFDGSGDYLATPSSAAFTLGSSGDFTVECWIYPIGTQSLYSTVVSTYTDFNSGGGYLNKWHLGYSTTTTLTWYDSAGNAVVSSTNHPINSWSHVAVVRSGSTITMYVNGASIGTQTTNQSYTSQSPVQVGFVTNAAYFNGYISNVRVVKGSAVYTSAFTPPTAPLTAIANTSLLLSTTNAGISDAAMMNDLETVGNAQVSTSVVKYGTGSMAFDGSGDWLAGAPTPQTDLGSGDFTLEAWLYRTASGAASDSGIVSRGAPSTLNGFVFGYSSANVLVFNFNYSGAIVTGVTVIAANTWTHVAVSRNGNTFRLFVNGVLDATATSTNSQTTNAGDIFYVGRSGYDSGRIVTGYLDDVRITKGAARYITNFTPPPARMPGQ